MAGTTYGHNQKPFPTPPAPAYFTGQQVRAFERGWDYYVFSHRDGSLAWRDGTQQARHRYKLRGMRQAFMEGWDAAAKLDRETNDDGTQKI